MEPILFQPVKSPYLVPYDGKFRVKGALTERPNGEPKKKEAREKLAELQEQMRDLQRKLYADDRYALLLVFQAMDAAGKDGTIRAVMTGLNPAGCQVESFKAPSDEELDHDFMWRIYKRLPEQGRIGIFNRSHYEEVLVVRVHPEILAAQKLPRPLSPEKRWRERYDSIRDFEKHLARNGTVILKFWLNVSKDEQRRRFIDRIDDPNANWKFSARDVLERTHWKEYMDAYEEALNETSRPWAPWYAIPANDKSYMRLVVAQVLCDTLKSLDLRYPTVPEETRERMHALREGLIAEG
jgi:PPK2 family polyphosphate:nucleotide phosphotransferase